MQYKTTCKSPQIQQEECKDKKIKQANKQTFE